METSTVINSNHFAISTSEPFVLKSSSPKIDYTYDSDMIFLKTIKDCKIKFDSISLIQAMPTIPLTGFHLELLSSLISSKPEALSLVKYILSNYKIEVDEVLFQYYKNKLDKS
jgi:hypothetical protein